MIYIEVGDHEYPLNFILFISLLVVKSRFEAGSVVWAVG